MSDLKFSVLIPAYKDAYLLSCIDSVLNQSYTNFEVVVVNDNSPFQIDEVIAKYSDSRIVYHKNRIGFGAIDVVDNWNKCLELASGDYIICMGDDDCLLPDCLMNYYHCIQDNPGYNVYHIRTEVIDEKGKVIGLQEERPMFETVYSMMWHRLAKNRIQFIGDYLFDRFFLVQHGGFFKLPYACYSDDISAYIAAKDRGILNINKLGFQYRKNGQTITNTQDLRVVTLSIQQAVGWMFSFLQRVPELKEDAAFRESILDFLPRYEKNMYAYCFYTDMSKNALKSSPFWWKHHKRFGISGGEFLKVYYKLTKQCFSRKMC